MQNGFGPVECASLGTGEANRQAGMARLLQRMATYDLLTVTLSQRGPHTAEFDEVRRPIA